MTNICVEAGNGLCKTTLLQRLKSSISCDYGEEVEIVTEPVKFLRDVLDQDLLQLFAENPKNISSPIHGHILSIMKNQRKHNEYIESIKGSWMDFLRINELKMKML